MAGEVNRVSTAAGPDVDDCQDGRYTGTECDEADAGLDPDGIEGGLVVLPSTSSALYPVRAVKPYKSLSAGPFPSIPEISWKH